MSACDRQTDGQTNGIAIAGTALAVRALRRAVKNEAYFDMKAYNTTQKTHHSLALAYIVLLCSRPPKSSIWLTDLVDISRPLCLFYSVPQWRWKRAIFGTHGRMFLFRHCRFSYSYKAYTQGNYNAYKKASIRWQDSARRQFPAGLRVDVGL